MSVDSLTRIAILTESGPDSMRSDLVLSVLQAVADEVRKEASIEIFLVGESRMGVPGLDCSESRRSVRWREALSALRTANLDAVILLEPDTLIPANFIRHHLDFLADGYGGLSLLDHHLLDTESEDAVFWDGHTGRLRNRPLANARCISRAWLDAADWSLFTQESDDLTEAMEARWSELVNLAFHAGEWRNFGTISCDLGVCVFRDGEDGLFAQVGESATIEPVSRVALLERYFGEMAELIITGELPEFTFENSGSYEIEWDEEELEPEVEEHLVTDTLLVGESDAPESAGDHASSVDELSLSEGGMVPNIPSTSPRPPHKVAAHNSGSVASPVQLGKRSITPNPTPVGETPNELPAPTTASGWVERGEIEFGRGDLDEAARCFRSALALNPIYAPALNDLAVIYHQRGEVELAERLYLKAVTFDPDQADAFVGLIGLMMQVGQTALAIRYAARGIRRAPSHPQLLSVVSELTQGGFEHLEKGA